MLVHSLLQSEVKNPRVFSNFYLLPSAISETQVRLRAESKIKINKTRLLSFCLVIGCWMMRSCECRREGMRNEDRMAEKQKAASGKV